MTRALTLIALLCSTAHAADRRLHLDLSGSFTYGIGSVNAFGTLIQLHGTTPIWNTTRATGSIEVGLAFGYQNEPQGLKPWLTPESEVTDQRIHLWLTIGHSFHLLKNRALRFGIFVFTGWSHYETRATLRIPRYAVDSSSSGSFDASSTGAGLKLEYLFTPRVGATLQMAAPFPYSPAPIVSYFHVAIGLLVHLR